MKFVYGVCMILNMIAAVISRMGNDTLGVITSGIFAIIMTILYVAEPIKSKEE